jgi:DNA-binding beta-propeller fold protein YncE
MTLGHPGVPGDAPGYFYRPSAVTIAPDGTIFVADGHGGESNARIVKVAPDGTVIKTWGKKGTAPGEFNEPHAIALDSQGRVFVADRVNSRIQILTRMASFSPTGSSSDGRARCLSTRTMCCTSLTRRPRTRLARQTRLSPRHPYRQR